jgi:hypothetical protein
MRRIKEMRRTKVLLAGVMAMSLAISSTVVPAGVNSTLGSLTGVKRTVAYAAENKKIPVEGMKDGATLSVMGANIGEDDEICEIKDGIMTFPTLADGVKYTITFDFDDDKYNMYDYELMVTGGKLRDSIDFIFKDGELCEVDKNNKYAETGNKITKIIVKEKKQFPKNSVKFPEFTVKYNDGTPVEDGVEIIVVLTQDQGGEQKLQVKDGKITPTFNANTNVLYTIGMSALSKNFDLVDVDNSNALDNVKNVNVFISDKDNELYDMKNRVDDFGNTSNKFNGLVLRKKVSAPLYTGPVVAIGVQPVEELKDISDDKTALGEPTGSAVKGKRIAPGKDVKVADIAVVFEDGTKVPDGVTLDNFRMKDIWAEPAHYKVKDGKISGIVLKADEQYKLGFDVTNADYNNYEVVGAYKSKKLLRVYARYEGGVLLKYDYDEGIEAPEEEISKIVIKKTDGKPSKLPVSTSCLMNLILSDHGYQPQGVLPFRLVRLDNKKSTLVYSSNDGILSLNGEAGVWYEMKLDKNPLYKLKDKTVFRFVLNKEGKYVALLKGYKNPDNLEGVVTSHYVELIRLDGKIPVGSALATGECTTGQKYSLKDYKIIYNTKRAEVKDIPVQFKSDALKKPVKFEIYNATKQKVEKVVLSKDGKLSGLKLIVGNDYIISALDKEYSMKNAYVTLSNDGKKLITSKAPYGEFKGFKLNKREKALTDEKMANRVPYKLPVYVLGNNKKKVNNVTLKFISPRETFEAKVVDGWVDLSLLEDTNYVMEVVKGNYAIDAFPLTVKDKSEFGAKKYVFNHLSCGSVQALYLINKKQAHKNDTTLVSSDGTTKVTGFRFGNGEYALSSRVLKNVKVPELKGKKYLVLDVDTVNMYRVELSPLAYGNFKVTTTVAGKKPVKNVYYIDGANKLQKVKFTQKGDKLTFNMNSMARYNTVIEYK